MYDDLLHPLLVAQVSTGRSPRSIKWDFMALGKLAEGVEAEEVFSSISSAEDTEKKRKSHLINIFLEDWCHCRN